MLLASLSGCESHFADEFYEFEDDCWSLKDTIKLNFNNSDTSAIYTLQFPLIFTEEYPFNNIYLRAMITSPSGDQNILPAKFTLMDPIGNWNSSPDGGQIPFKLGIADGLKFNQQGGYSIKFYHFMQDDPLCGIQKVGILLDEMSRKD